MINGLIGKKIEMTQVFAEDGKVTPVTVLVLGPCVVTQIKTQKRDGYDGVQVGFGEIKKNKMKKSMEGHLKNIDQKLRVLGEFRMKEDTQDLEIGKVIKAQDVLEVGQKVQVTGVSKGRGFAGVVKRHGFHGGPKTHGQSDRLRAPGSIGGGTDPGRVMRGKKMPGHMGNEQVTTKGLEIIEIDEEKNEVKIKGTAPGYRGSIVIVRDMNRLRKNKK